MPKRKQPPAYARMGCKDHWHPYNLQALTPAKFIRVVGKILDGQYRVLTSRLERGAPL